MTDRTCGTNEKMGGGLKPNRHCQDGRFRLAFEQPCYLTIRSTCPAALPRTLGTRNDQRHRSLCPVRGSTAGADYAERTHQVRIQHQATQFVVGLGHLEGYGIEKNERSAYYWLRMAEEKSGAIARSRVLLEKLRSTVKRGDIDAVEQMVAGTGE
jgi:hypothetical protein